jgi:hypothetical protein
MLLISSYFPITLLFTLYSMSLNSRRPSHQQSRFLLNSLSHLKLMCFVFLSKYSSVAWNHMATIWLLKFLSSGHPDHHQWLPGSSKKNRSFSFQQHRLEDKPVFKEGGMSRWWGIKLCIKEASRWTRRRELMVRQLKSSPRRKTGQVSHGPNANPSPIPSIAAQSGRCHSRVRAEVIQRGETFMNGK